MSRAHSPPGSDPASRSEPLSGEGQRTGSPAPQQRHQPVSYDNMFSDMLDVMEFESWWTERGPSGASIRRYMLILFFPGEGQFQVTVDDSKTPLTVKVVTRYGEPLHAYDLHVGAVIDVLGRPTTLMSASLRVITWLERHTRRLWRRLQALEERVNKFRPMPLHALDFGIYRRLKDPNAALGGMVPMRKILDAIRSLESELATFQ